MHSFAKFMEVFLHILCSAAMLSADLFPETLEKVTDNNKNVSKISMQSNVGFIIESIIR